LDFYEFIEFLGKEALKDLMPAKIPRERMIEDDLDHEFLLFTGQLYQITPYLNSIRDMLERLERSEEMLFSFYKMGENFLWKLVKPKEKERFNSIVIKSYSSLKKKIDIGYDFSIDYYSGIIFHDLGSRIFEDYAKIMAKKLNGKKLVTIDPHTTYAVKVLYRKVDESFNAEVHHYTEFLKLPDVNQYADHESCYLNRYLQLNYGSNAAKPLASGKEMGCCGGPIEFVSPKLATEIAKVRINQLLSTGKDKVLVWCPICLSNLSRLNMAQVKDALELMG
jgi:Fe-S oxidoreductase